MFFQIEKFSLKFYSYHTEFESKFELELGNYARGWLLKLGNSLGTDGLCLSKEREDETHILEAGVSM